MPKMKTRRAVAKRFQMTAKGKAKLKKANLRHILTKKSTKSKRQKRSTAFVSQADMAHINRCLPYKGK